MGVPVPLPVPAPAWTRPSHRGRRRGARSRPRRPRGAPPPRAAGWGTPAACTRWAPPGRRRRRRGGTPAIDHGRAGQRRRVCHPLRRSPAARAAVGGGPTPPRPRVARWAVGRPWRAAHPAGRPRAGRRRAGASQVGRPRGRPHWVCFCLASRPTRACTCVWDTSVGRSVGSPGALDGPVTPPRPPPPPALRFIHGLDLRVPRQEHPKLERAHQSQGVERHGTPPRHAVLHLGKVFQ